VSSRTVRLLDHRRRSEAASAADRLAIVGAERDAIAGACLKILEEGPLTTAFPEFSPLAQATVKALIEGHFQAAQALAVNVIESFVREWVAERYRTVKQYAQDGPRRQSVGEWRVILRRTSIR
jgi:hypothetical protein